jgi:hypothetical protein
MGRFVTLVLTNFLMLSMTWATSFHPVPIEQLIETSDAIVVADFLGSKSIVLEDGMIATESRFRLETEVGLAAFEHGFRDILVYHPGGLVQGKALQVEGVPRFVIGEKNVLMLKALDDGRLWVQGLAMGTFKMVRIGDQNLIINPIFPDDHRLSMIKFDTFQAKVDSIKKQALRAVDSDKYVLEMEKTRKFVPNPDPRTAGKSRSVASVEAPRDNGREPNVMDSFWLITMLSTLGVLAAWRTRRSQK